MSPPATARSSASARASWSAVAVTERFVLASLMVFDLRSVLRDLAAGELPRTETRTDD